MFSLACLISAAAPSPTELAPRESAHAALLSACAASDGPACVSAAAAFAAGARPARSRQLQSDLLDLVSMVTDGYGNWGYFGVSIKGRFVFCTVGAFAGVIAGPAVGLALIAAVLAYNFGRIGKGSVVGGARGGGPAAAAAPIAGAMRSNPLGAALPAAAARAGGGGGRANPREEAQRHWNNGAGELPPGWDWTEGELGRICYVDFQGHTTYMDPRKSFEVYAHEFQLAAERGVDLLNMCVGCAVRPAAPPPPHTYTPHTHCFPLPFSRPQPAPLPGTHGRRRTTCTTQISFPEGLAGFLGGPAGFPRGPAAGFPRGLAAGFLRVPVAGFLRGLAVGSPRGLAAGLPRGLAADFLGGPVAGFLRGRADLSTPATKLPAGHRVGDKYTAF